MQQDEGGEGTPESNAGKVGKVRDAFRPSEAAHVVKPQGLHKVVERQCYRQATPAPPQKACQQL